ncbi:unnamed protein product [Penicillium salamii]|uniref:Uncharacterized protein n=1 Tax=Penicillium salamii TaxID=1612424 RepID=A0A9W4N0K9_9EURO|nr:unnamed protein product [Penicillium salamii]CAG7985209.1 unnamed protein product [Penicillium salamii]CAG8004232.1 unnamed protein product [Penicillium salamii]CAG8212693.1 unnamed protein product [Penicillium salamii]CAG8244581.1 unnamed protein product [Penicillium salamii]
MSQDPHHQMLDTPDGSALTWIFDHCLRYSDSYDISLRAAYELNCQSTKNMASSGASTSSHSRSPSVFSRNSSLSKDSRSSRTSSGSSYETNPWDTNAEFRACLTRTVSEMPSQPCALPPTFIASFVRRVFTKELRYVTFSQALCSLDYLKGLQGRWKKEVDGAFRRINVNPQDVIDPQSSEVTRNFPGVMVWYKDISQKARVIDMLYTQVYVGLRRWIILNEMMLQPYNKANCIALLNTLFPPVRYDSPPPTQHLSHKHLENHRDSFFKFITLFDIKPEILEPVMTQGARPGDGTSWPALRDAFDRYLGMVLEMIDECALVNEPAQLTKSGHSRRTDSGISFEPQPTLCLATLSRSTPSRPTTSHSSGQASDIEKPLPEFPAPTDGASKHGSILERLAFSVSTWGKKDGKKARSLRKMQSCKELKDSSEKHNVPDFSKMKFDLTDEKRRRLIDEALARKAAEAKAAETRPIGLAI